MSVHVLSKNSLCLEPLITLSTGVRPHVRVRPLVSLDLRLTVEQSTTLFTRKSLLCVLLDDVNIQVVLGVEHLTTMFAGILLISVEVFKVMIVPSGRLEDRTTHFARSDSRPVLFSLMFPQSTIIDSNKTTNTALFGRLTQLEMDVSYVRSQSFVVLEVSLAEVAVELGVEPLFDDLVDLDPDVVPLDVSEGPVLDGKPTATAPAHEGSLLTVTLGDVGKYHFLGLVVELAVSVTRTEVTLPHSPVPTVLLLYPIEDLVQKLGVTVNQIIQRKTVDFFRRTVSKDFF